MLSLDYAECHKQTHHAECGKAECRGTQNKPWPVRFTVVINSFS
jgi:hypothetical protein